MNTVDFINDVKSLLVSNNTTTSSNDISFGLDTRVKMFMAGVNNFSAIVPVAITTYPAIFVETNNKDQSFGLLGNTTKRDQKINFSIVCVTQYNTNGDLEATAQESIKLSDNIEELLNTKVRLSQTSIVLKSGIVNTEYGVRLDDSYNNYITKLNITADIWST